ncbi:S41 family peptidase [Sneathiella sp. CAU 1612]|uniref:S41 family peptidase n=1 Tax=Sneathiella sedimenti TaxID=2816034 RepID=A0ABS3F342_9PROT|nr:S41 family peptidase [Sneathiella sedimenti]MBO0332926.1 S41 family peptidase [Sneathiella sedimenti]
MFKRILIALNILMLVTACAIPITRNHDVNAAMNRYEIAYRETVKNDPMMDENISIMADVLQTIDQRYVDNVNPDDLIDKAIEGLKSVPIEGRGESDPTTRALNAMLASMDRYTGYMAPQRFSSYRESLDGHFVGLGIHIRMIDDNLTVMSLLRGSGAEEAGLQEKDIITHVDGEPIKGLTLSEAREKLRGPEDSYASLTILRNNTPTPLQVDVMRRDVEVAAVEHRIDGNIGYIRIFSFTRKTGPGVATALKDIQYTLGPNLCGIVLDMRNNPGGLVSAAEIVADAFLDSGNIYSVRNRGRELVSRDAVQGDETQGKPIVVMLNKKSASSSEIVAGALKYQARAKLFGEKSYGKGLMQSLMPLRNGGGLRLTTGRFTTGGGPTFHGVGLTPDIPHVVHEGESDEAQISLAAKSLNCSTDIKTALVTSQ